MSDELRVVLRDVLLLSQVVIVGCGGGPAASARPAVSQAPSTPAPATAAGTQGDAARPGAVPIDLTATVAGTRYQVQGVGDCAHADDGSIYEAPASMWHAALRADGSFVSYVNLTVWQLRSGGPSQFALALQTGGDFRHIATIKGATIIGRGTARVDRAGDGATLEVDGADGKGVSIQISLRCARVTQAMEEGSR